MRAPQTWFHPIGDWTPGAGGHTLKLHKTRTYVRSLCNVPAFIMSLGCCFIIIIIILNVYFSSYVDLVSWYGQHLWSAHRNATGCVQACVQWLNPSTGSYKCIASCNLTQNNNYVSLQSTYTADGRVQKFARPMAFLRTCEFYMFN